MCHSFIDVYALREVVRYYTIEGSYELVRKQLDTKRLIVSCGNDECPWRLHASILAYQNDFPDKKSTRWVYLCKSIGTKNSNRTINWIVKILKEKLKVDLNMFGHKLNVMTIPIILQS